MRIGSLFSGAGGLDVAVESVFGAETVWHCEIEPAASKVLAARWPDVPNLLDITEVNWSNWKPLLEVDILCGGYPCQPFSAAGQRKGASDERHLWPYFAEAIRVLRPRFVVLENVAGHRSMGFDRVLADLAKIGYDAQWCCVRASDVGAPHRRERIFVLAHPTGSGAADRIQRSSSPGFDVSTISRAGDRNSERTTAARVSELGSVAAELADVSASGTGPVELLPTPRATRGGSNTETVDLLPTPRRSDGDGGANPLSRAERMDDVETRILRLLPTPKASDGEFATPRTSGRPVEKSTHLQTIATLTLEWGKYEPAIRRWEQLTRSSPAPTEPNTKGNPRLSAAFSEWMMGWPAGWVTDVPGISRNDALRIIGNGVVPQCAAAALRWLLQIAEVAA